MYLYRRKERIYLTNNKITMDISNMKVSDFYNLIQKNYPECGLVASWKFD